MAKTATLVDTFDVDDGTWIDAAAGGTIGSGVCTMPYLLASTVKQTAVDYDLTESHVFVEVDHNQTNGNETYFLFGTPGGIFENGQVLFAMSAMNIFYREVQADGTVTDLEDAYDSVAMAFLRLRHAGTTVFWDTSPDGSTWTNRWSKTAEVTLTAARVKLGAFNGAGDQPDAAIFDDVNTTAAASSATSIGATIGIAATAAKHASSGAAIGLTVDASGTASKGGSAGAELDLTVGAGTDSTAKGGQADAELALTAGIAGAAEIVASTSTSLGLELGITGAVTAKHGDTAGSLDLALDIAGSGQDADFIPDPDRTWRIVPESRAMVIPAETRTLVVEGA